MNAYPQLLKNFRLVYKMLKYLYEIQMKIHSRDKLHFKQFKKLLLII